MSTPVICLQRKKQDCASNGLAKLSQVSTLSPKQSQVDNSAAGEGAGVKPG